MAKSVNKVILVGNVGQDPEVKYTAGGVPVAKLSLATNERFKDRNDADPRMKPEDVKTIYSHQYPELATAAITGPEASGEQLQYSFVRAIGTKG